MGILRLTDRTPQCHSCLAICAFVLLVSRSAVISDGTVCCLFEQGVQFDSSHRPWRISASPICRTTPSPFNGRQIVYTVCALPQTVPFLCENIPKNNGHPPQGLLGCGRRGVWVPKGAIPGGTVVAALDPHTAVGAAEVGPCREFPRGPSPPAP